MLQYIINAAPCMTARSFFLILTDLGVTLDGTGFWTLGEGLSRAEKRRNQRSGNPEAVPIAKQENELACVCFCGTHGYV